MATRTMSEKAHMAQHRVADASRALDLFPDDGRGERRQARLSHSPLTLRWRLTPDGLIGRWERASAGEKTGLAKERVSA
jgi:hypothetical protein